MKKKNKKKNKKKTTNSKYSVGYSDKATGPLILIMLKMSRYVKTVKVKDEDKDKINKICLYV